MALIMCKICMIPIMTYLRGYSQIKSFATLAPILLIMECFFSRKDKPINSNHSFNLITSFKP